VVHIVTTVLWRFEIYCCWWQTWNDFAIYRHWTKPRQLEMCLVVFTPHFDVRLLHLQSIVAFVNPFLRSQSELRYKNCLSKTIFNCVWLNINDIKFVSEEKFQVYHTISLINHNVIYYWIYCYERTDNIQCDITSKIKLRRVHVQK
jgi:hypothetical protein